MSLTQNAFPRSVVAILFALCCGVSSIAHAQEHRSREHETRDHEFREHEFHQREFMDSRFHHEHYYPPHGYVFTALPHEHHVIFFAGTHYFFSDGIWYRRYNENYIVIAPPLGVVAPVLPPAYATVWVGGVPYYYANNVFYVRNPSGYMVVQEPPSTMIVEHPPVNGVVELGPVNSAAPPPAAASPPPPVAMAATSTPQFFIYPRQGQSQELQVKDRYECHSWSVAQLGTDPTAVPAGQLNPTLSDYQRALSACMDGRGYTVK